ncbi:hypothetical protein O0L34_g2525 [Tuta absoluta]|nr:hypothetical protein O0L34_g2525 [Tuta absoluta]
MKICKRTHSGISFTGAISHSSQGLRCLRWTSVTRPFSSLKDSDFADGSITKAKNYCRNPTKDVDGPWCYVRVGRSPVKQPCRVRLCASPCRLTGPGVEYSGTTSRAMHRDCEKWNNDWHKRKVKLLNSSVVHAIAYSDDKFPDKNVHSASNYCRNPDGSLGGKLLT